MTTVLRYRLGNNLAGQYKRAAGMALHIGMGNFAGGGSNPNPVQCFAQDSAHSYCIKYVQGQRCSPVQTRA